MRVLGLLSLLLLGCGPRVPEVGLLNVSYDATRELYGDVNRAFAPQYRARHGARLVVRQSHGGSGAQARAVLEGLPADVVTLGLAYDVERISDAGLIDAAWRGRLPHRSAPYTSTIVFLVRRGNPKHLHDWSDLVRPGVQVVVPNPKTSGAARWAYLAAWGWALRQPGGTPQSAADFVQRFYRNVPVLDSGGRGATTTFVRNGIGDVLVGWESEALRFAQPRFAGRYEVVIPSASILAEPVVSVVDRNVDRHGRRAVADEYLEFLYTPEAQELCAKHFYRPIDEAVLARHSDRFRTLPLFTVEDVFGSWKEAHETHFADGGEFDRLYNQGSVAAR